MTTDVLFLETINFKKEDIGCHYVQAVNLVARRFIHKLVGEGRTQVDCFALY